MILITSLLLLGVAVWFILSRAEFDGDKRARRRELDRLFQRESALRSWERMINQDRKFR